VLKFCEEAEISPQFYYSVIRGEAKSVKAETLERIQNALGETYPGWDSDPTGSATAPPKSSPKRRREAVTVAVVDTQVIPDGTRVRVPAGWEAEVIGCEGNGRYQVRFLTGIPGQTDTYLASMLKIC
jgi:hypothetical protein